MRLHLLKSKKSGSRDLTPGNLRGRHACYPSVLSLNYLRTAFASIRSAVLTHLKGSASSIHWSMNAWIAFLSGVTPLKDALRTARLVTIENHVSTWFIQDVNVGVKSSS